MGDKAGPSDTPYFNLDKSSENYIRLCRLITTICGSLLRLILSRQIEPDNLRKELDIHRTKLEKNINTQQKEQLYLKAGCKSISPKDLDISVLYVLLRNICTKLSPPKTGWGKPPQKGDNSESAFIERVRHIRNIISAHNTHGKVSDTDFQQYWEELEHSIIAMEKKLTGDDVYQDAMSKIKAMTFNKDDAEKYKLEIQQSEDEKESEPQDLPKDKACVGSNAKKPRCSPNSKLVAAIDFGTAYSGHAFSSRVDFENDPLQIKAHKWSKSLLAHKTPTSALFDENKTLIAFGYEAEKKFRELSDDGKHHDHYFFERFKMQLYNKSGDTKQTMLTNKSMIRDISRKELPAMYVFSKAIEYMHNHLLNGLKEQDDDKIAEENINWVLTVPAIWNDSAKQFMRDAAKQAGINNDNLTIALEPEAASMYCKKIQLVKLKEPKAEFQIFSPGNQYLILDAGGGTVDITIHEVLPEDRIKELHKATGGAWGGTYLDDEFFKIFEECFGKDEFEEFKREDLAGYIELVKDLEMQKRDIRTTTPKMALTIPPYLKNKCDISRSKFAERLVCKGGKLEFNGWLINKWYSEVCDKIKEHVRNLVEEHKIDIILMVGGFSESLFLQETMTKAFPNKHIVVPNEASLAVLKGAVLFGHNPSSIVSRVAQFTYGVNTSLPVEGEENVLDEKRIKIIGGVKYKTDVFRIHVKKGESLEFGKAQHEMVYHPLLKNQKTIRFRLYTSSIENPKYVDDPECRPLGYINVDIPDTSEGLDRKVRVRFIFGGTEIKVEGVNERTGDVTSVEFDYYDCTEEGERFLCKPGGTVDITIHEVLPDDRIKELHKATGGAWGGTYLDEEFFKIFEECFGKDEFEEFKRNDLAGYIDLVKDLEKQKRDISTTTPKISLTIPPCLKIRCDISRSKFSKGLECKGEKLKFDGGLINTLYSEVCEHVGNLLKEHNIDIILMVGVFSESLFLQETMTKAFSNKHIVVPNEASLAVLKGAVLFGLKPSSIISRVAKFTYGVETSLPIKDEETVLDEKRIAIIDGVRYERGVFSKHVTKGANLEVDKAQYEMAYLPLLKTKKTIRFRVYTSSIKNPKYVDDPECRPLGYINVDIPDSSEGLDRKVRVRFIFGGTEIKVEGVNERTGEIASVKFVYSDTTEEQRFLCKPDD